MDLSFNQVAGLGALCFLEQVGFSLQIFMTSLYENVIESS